MDKISCQKKILKRFFFHSFHSHICDQTPRVYPSPASLSIYAYLRQARCSPEPRASSQTASTLLVVVAKTRLVCCRRHPRRMDDKWLRNRCLLDFQVELETVFYWIPNFLLRFTTENLTVTQLRFIHNWFITGIQWMLHWWVLVYFVCQHAGNRNPRLQFSGHCAVVKTAR